MNYLTILLFVNLSLAVFGQHWVQLSNFPGTSRDDGTVFVINDRAYCGLGKNPWFGCEGSFNVFDLNTETWSPGMAIPVGEERQYANGFSHNGYGYVFGGIGEDDIYRNDLWQYDPVNQNWTLQTPLPSAGRAGAVEFVIADTVYIIGGKSQTDVALNEVWGYDLVNQQWSRKTDLPFDGIWRGVAFSWNETGIAGSGKNNTGNLNSTFYSYSPQTNSWTTITGLTMEPASYLSAVQIGEMAFLYGGVNVSGIFSNTFRRLNLETFEITTLTSFPSEARKGVMAFAGANEFYMTTGISATGRLDETWKSYHVLELNENTAKNQIQVFPNPVEGLIHISSAELIVQLQITDVSGELMLQQPCESNEIQLDTDFPAGIYFLEIIGKSSRSTVKIGIN